MFSDVTELYNRHALDGPRIDAWVEHAGGLQAIAKQIGPIAEMRGTFNRTTTLNFYSWTFVPTGTGKHRAIVLPVTEGGKLVDLVALDKGDDQRWGCVTGQGRFLNFDAIHSDETAPPLRVEQTWYQWLRRDCVGVLPLSHAALPFLSHARGGLVVDEPSHARQLLYNVYVFGSKDRLKATKLGKSRIFLDIDDNELSVDLAKRVVASATRKVSA